MFGDLLGRVFEFIEFLWPLSKVEQWEGGVYQVFGKMRKCVGPGIWPKFPWFIDVHVTSTAWRPIGTGRHDITTKDGNMLTFEAIALFRVVELKKSMVVIHDDEHGMLNLLTSVLAERLAEGDPERFAPEKRGRLNTSLQQAVEREAAEFGLEVKWVRFSTFVLNPKTFRLLSESAPFIA